MKAIAVSIGSVTCVVAILYCPSAGGSREPAQPKAAKLELAAQVEAFEQISIHSKVAAQVQKIHVAIGDRVRSGDVLAQLAVPEIDAAIRVKEARLKQADAKIELATRGVEVADAAVVASEGQVREAEAAVLRERANLNYRKLAYDRLEALMRQKAIDEKQIDEGKLRLESAKANLAETEAKLKSVFAALEGTKAKRGVVQAEVQVAKARRDSARAELERVDVQRQAATLRAPFDSVVARRNVDAGALVMPGGGPKAEPLLVLVRVEIVRIVVAIPEGAIASVKVDTPVRVRIPALKGKEITAKIARLAPVLDPKARTRRAEIDVPNADGSLLPGMSATVAFTTSGPIDEPKEEQRPKGGKEERAAPATKASMQQRKGPAVHVIQPLAGMDPVQIKNVIGNYYEYHFRFIDGVHKVESRPVGKVSVTRLHVERTEEVSKVMAEAIESIKRSRAFMPPGIAPALVIRMEAVCVPGLNFSAPLPVGKGVR